MKVNYRGGRPYHIQTEEIMFVPPESQRSRPLLSPNEIPNVHENDDLLEPLAIIGFSLKYPQDADTAEGFWRVLQERRDVMTEWPKDRIKLDAFFYHDENQEQQVR